LRVLSRARITRGMRNAKARQQGADRDGLLRHPGPRGENGRVDERGSGAGRGRRVASGQGGGDESAGERTHAPCDTSMAADASRIDAVSHEILWWSPGRACDAIVNGTYLKNAGAFPGRTPDGGSEATHRTDACIESL